MRDAQEAIYCDWCHKRIVGLLGHRPHEYEVQVTNELGDAHYWHVCQACRTALERLKLKRGRLAKQSA